MEKRLAHNSRRQRATRHLRLEDLKLTSKFIAAVLLSTLLPTASFASASLAKDPRISKPNSFIDAQNCLTIDKTYGEGFSKIASSGFPRPESSIVGKTLGKILVLPINFTDYIFLDSDRASYQNSFNSTTKFYKKISWARFNVSFEWAPKEKWIDLPHEASYYGITNNKPQQDNQLVAVEAIANADESLNLGQYEAVFIITNSFKESGGGQAFIGSNFQSKSGIVKNSMLMFGRGVSGWPNVAHELGHALFALEDLYLFQTQGGQQVKQNTKSFTAWDLMAGSTPDFSGWNKLLMGFINKNEIKCLDDSKRKIIFLSLLDLKGGTKLGVINLEPGVSVCFEAKKDYDGSIGLLIYEVNTNFDHGNGPFWGEDSLLKKGKTTEFEGAKFKVLGSSKEGVLVQIN